MLASSSLDKIIDQPRDALSQSPLFAAKLMWLILWPVVWYESHNPFPLAFLYSIVTDCSVGAGLTASAQNPQFMRPGNLKYVALFFATFARSSVCVIILQTFNHVQSQAVPILPSKEPIATACHFEAILLIESRPFCQS
jgi:hypothetical protein